MKKARILKLLGLFCIILSFFASVNAVSQTGNFFVDDKNVNSVVEDTNGINIKAVATDSDPSGKVTFEARTTGVFSINVTGNYLDLNEIDLYYLLTDSDGNQIRLAAEYTSNKYVIITERGEFQTDIDVILQAGKQYTLELVTGKKGCAPLLQNKGETYVESDGNSVKEKGFSIRISPNEDANNKKFYQSNVSSSELSSAVETDDNELETVNSEYEINSSAKPGTSNATWKTSSSSKKNKKDSSWGPNPFDYAMSTLLLGVGDGLISLMNAILGEEVTISSLVYNLFDPVNPNFFDKTISWYGVTKIIKDVVSNWYNIFSVIAAAIYIVVLLIIGINILLHSTGEGLSKAKKMLTEWFKGVALLVFIPYVIKYALMINESIVGLLREAGDMRSYKVGSTIGNSTEWSAEEIEFRSPEYVSKYTGNVKFGSEDATRAYLKNIGTYEQNLDLMRIMRAYAGVTRRIIYAIIWYILLGQLIAFIVQYYKRYFLFAFLFAMFPLICIFNGISLAKGSPGKEIGNWLKEILTNIFVQTVHAIIYTVITGVCISVVKEDLSSSATLNWLVIILAINFMSEGEKLLKKIISALGSTTSTVGATGQGIKNAYGKAKQGFSQVVGKN